MKVKNSGSRSPEGEKSPLRSSLILDDKYRITGKIGRGSFGSIPVLFQKIIIQESYIRLKRLTLTN